VVVLAALLVAACRAGSDAPPCREPARLGAGPISQRSRPAVRGVVYHVGPRGNDAGDCSAAAPCREIKRAVPLLAPGDLLVIDSGEYRRFTWVGPRGRADAPITLFAEAGAVVRGIEGCGRRDRSCRDAILIDRADHLVIDGLGATGATRAGLAIELSQHVTVRNGVFVDNGRWGVFSSFVDDLTIEHVEAAASRTEHGIYASNSGDRTVIRRNWVHDNRACGIQINADWSVKDPAHAYPGEVDGITTGALIEGNIVFRNGKGGGAAINLDGVQDSTVRNNLLVDNAASGIVAYGDEDGVEDMSRDDGDGRQGPRGMVIAHNTVVQAPGARAALTVRYSVGRNLVRNNVLYHPDGPSIMVGGDKDVAHLDSDHNVIGRVDIDGHSTDGGLVDLGAWRRRGRDRHSLATAGPSDLFAAAGCDFTPAVSSPLRDRGVAVDGGELDLRERPRGTAPDLGALEAP
jgi:hypothetical protein